MCSGNFFVYNTVMNKRNVRGAGQGKTDFLLPLLFLIAAAALLLGFLQFRWISSVSTAEGSRLKQSLRNSAAQVINVASDEVRVLQALLYLTEEEFANRDWSRFSSSYEFWKANSRFPELLSDVYLVVLEDAGPSFLEYKVEKKTFASAEKPQVFEELNGDKDSADVFIRQLGETLMERGVLFSPIGLPRFSDKGSEPIFPVFLALTVHPGILYREVIPFYMDRYLEGHPYRISEAETGGTLISFGDFDPAREPEFSISPSTPLLFWNRRPSEKQEDRESGDNLARDLLSAYTQAHLGEDPSTRFWTQSRTLGVDPGRHPEQRIKPLFRLDIYYPGGPLESIISTRRIVNLAVSAVVLLLLVSSSAILFRLYRNTTRLRATEQEFVASMSHELRTPIAVLQSTTENLRSGVVTDPSRVSRYGEIIHRETRRLAGMVENILLYSGLEKRAPGSGTLVPLDVGKLIKEVLTSLREPATEARCTIRLIEKTAPASIHSDPAALRLILENLLLNAIRHGVSSDAEEDDAAEIRLIVEQDLFNRGLLIAVEDDGSGIPSREQRRIFEPFVRGEASVRAQQPGSGLGLHLVRRLVRILGGSITLESPYENTIGQTQKGCRFVIELPGKPVGKNHAEDSDHRG